MTGQQLISIFYDTQSRFLTDRRLAAKTEFAKGNSRLYYENHVSSRRKEKTPCDVCVEEKTSFQCAREELDPSAKTAVLNFANPHEPGGGVKRGAMAQEECLCRCSNLYQTLNQPFFLDNYYRWHHNTCGSLFSDRIIYSPGVTVIKSDDSVPQLLDHPFEVDIITCAAPYLGDWKLNMSGRELLPVYESRIQNIFEVAMENDVDTLILGAFGCGVFRNDPHFMATAFHNKLFRDGYGKFFSKIRFAIKKTGHNCPNLSVFEAVFG